MPILEKPDSILSAVSVKAFYARCRVAHDNDSFSDISQVWQNGNIDMSITNNVRARREPT